MAYTALDGNTRALAASRDASLSGEAEEIDDIETGATTPLLCFSSCSPTKKKTAKYETDRNEYMVSRDGLPLPIEKGIAGCCKDFICWLISLVVLCGLIWMKKKQLFLNEFYPLSDGITGNFHLYNCDIDFRPYDDLYWWRPDYLKHIHNQVLYHGNPRQSMVHLRYPVLLTKPNYSVQVDKHSANVTMAVDIRRSFLPCRATLYLRDLTKFGHRLSGENHLPKHHFRNFDVQLLSSGDHRLDAYFGMGLKVRENFSMHVHQAQIRVTHGIEAQDVLLNATDGLVEVMVNRTMRPENIMIETVKAPVSFIAHDLDIDVNMNTGAAKMSVLWASGGITGFDNSDPASSKSPKLKTGMADAPSVKLRISAPEKGSPGMYLLANNTKRHGCYPKCMDVKEPEWGKGQDKPNLNTAGLNRLKKIKKWVQQDEKAPYIVYVFVVNPHTPHGTWRFMSSRVYLAFDTQIFVMFSAGMLKPRMQKITIHIDGLWNWPKGYSKVWSTKEMLKHCYSVLYEFFDHTENTVMVFSPSDKKSISDALIFEATDDGHVHMRSVSLEDTGLFIVAACLNCLSAVILGVVMVYLVYRFGFPILLKKISDASCQLNATHRLTNQVGQATSTWRVLVYISDIDLAGEKEHGIIFRWKTRSDTKSVRRYAITAKARKWEWDYGRFKMKTHTFEVRLRKDMVKVVKDNPDQSTFFMSTVHPGTRERLKVEPFHDPLQYGWRYRFTFKAWGEAGKLLATSQETNVMEMKPPVMLTELPFLLCQYFMPAPVDSLAEFVKDHTRPAIESQLIFLLQNVEVRYLGGENDPVLEKDWRLAFWFGDWADAAKDATQRGEQQSYAVSEPLRETSVVPKARLADPWMKIQCEDERSGFPLARPTKMEGAQIKSLCIALFLGSDEKAGEVELPYRSLIQCWDGPPLKEMKENRDIEYSIKPYESGGFTAEACIQLRFNVGFKYFGTWSESKNYREMLDTRGRRFFFNADVLYTTYFNGYTRLLTWSPGRCKCQPGRVNLTFRLVFMEIDFDQPVLSCWKDMCSANAGLKYPTKLFDEDDAFTSLSKRIRRPRLALTITEKGKGVPLASGAFSWTLFVEPEIFDYLGKDEVKVQIEVVGGRGDKWPGEQKETGGQEEAVIQDKIHNDFLDQKGSEGDEFFEAQCPEFYIQRCFLLGDFEIAYAAFCRYNSLAMEKVEPAKLDEMGIRLMMPQLAIVKGCRDFFPFESEDKSNYNSAFMSEGAMVCDHDVEYKLQPRPPCDPNQMDNKTHNKLATEVARLPVLDNRGLIPSATWEKRYLLCRGIDYVPYTVVTFFINPIYSVLPESRLLNTVMEYLIGVLYQAGWAVNMIGCFIAQNLIFQWAPIVQLVGLYVFCWAQQNVNPGYWTHSQYSENQLSDMAFAQDPFFVTHLPPDLLWILQLIAFDSIVFFLLVLWGNFISPMASVDIAYFVEKFAKFWFGKSVFLVIWIMVVVMLWFVLGALINPDALLPVAVGVISMIGTAESLWTEFTGLHDKVLEAVDAQVDMILGVVLDQFFDVFGITDKDMLEFTVEEENNAAKIKTAMDARLALVSIPDRFNFVTERMQKLKNRKKASVQGFSGSLDNMVRLRNAHRYFMNQLDIVQIVTLMGNVDLLACIKKGGHDKIASLFNTTWASTMVPLFGDAAKPYADVTVMQDLGHVLKQDKHIEISLWQLTESKKDYIAGIYADMMEDLYDRDAIMETVSSFYDTQLTLMLNNEINFLLSPSAAKSPVLQMAKKKLSKLEDKLVEAAQNGIRYSIRSPESKDTSIVKLLSDLGIVPPGQPATEDQHARELNRKMDRTMSSKPSDKQQFSQVYTEEALVCAIEEQRNRICSNNSVSAVQALDIIKGLLKNKLTWHQFNFLLLVLGVNDCKQQLGEEINSTIQCTGGKVDDTFYPKRSFNGYYKLMPETKGKDKATYKWFEAGREAEGRPEEGAEDKYLIHRIKEPKVMGAQESGNRKSKEGWHWEHVVNGQVMFKTGKVENKDVPQSGPVISYAPRPDEWVAVDGKGEAILGDDDCRPEQVYSFMFNERKVVQECLNVQLYGLKEADGKQDPLTREAAKLFRILSHKTGLLDASCAADAIMALTGKRIWQSAGCALLKKLELGGEYGTQWLHDRARAFNNLNVELENDDDDMSWKKTIKPPEGGPPIRSLAKQVYKYFPAQWWYVKHQTFDWHYKQFSEELSLSECWKIFAAQEEETAAAAGQASKTGPSMAWMSRGSFISFLDCIRFVPIRKGYSEDTTNGAMGHRQTVNDSNPLDFVKIPAVEGDYNEASEVITLHGRNYTKLGGRPRWIEEQIPKVYPSDEKKGQRTPQAGVKKIWHKPEGSSHWYRIKGITLEQCEKLLTTIGYNVQPNAFRTQWTTFVSLPYCPFNVLYSGVEDRTTSGKTDDASIDFRAPKRRYTMHPSLLDGTAAKNFGECDESILPVSLFQFCGTKMMTIDKFRFLLEQLKISLPPDVVTLIFNRCDNPQKGSDYATIQNFRNGVPITVKMTGKDWIEMLNRNPQQKDEDRPRNTKNPKSKYYGDMNVGQAIQLDQANRDYADVILDYTINKVAWRCFLPDDVDVFLVDSVTIAETVLPLIAPKTYTTTGVSMTEVSYPPKPIKIFGYNPYCTEQATPNVQAKELLCNAFEYEFHQIEALQQELSDLSDKANEDGVGEPQLRKRKDELKKKEAEIAKWFTDNKEAKERMENCIVTLNVKSLEGLDGDWRGAVVSIETLKEAVSEYLKAGLYFEAVEQICRDSLGLRYPTDVFRKAFNAVDLDNNGYLEPSEFYLMLLKLFKMGMTFENLHDLLVNIGMSVDRKALLNTFQIMDVDQSQTLAADEFLTGIDTLLTTVIPATVLEKTKLTPPKILATVSGAVVILLLVFVFIFLSMSAFTGPASTSSSIQSVLMGGSAFVVKKKNGAPDFEKLQRQIVDQINTVMGIDKRQAQQAKKKKTA